MTALAQPRPFRKKSFEEVMLWRALQHVDRGFYIDIRADLPEQAANNSVFDESGWRGLRIDPVSTEPSAPLGVSWLIGASSTTAPTTPISKMPPMPLTEVCERYVKGDIHFLKIDALGAEKTLIQGLDFFHWKPWLVVIKASSKSANDNAYPEWDRLLGMAGYTMTYFDGRSRYYVSPEHPELHGAFCAPSTIAEAMMPEARDRLGRLSAAEAEKIALNADLLAAQNKIREIQALAKEKEQLIRRASEQLENVYASPSWKVTQPLRWLVQQFYRHWSQAEKTVRHEQAKLQTLPDKLAKVPGMGWLGKDDNDASATPATAASNPRDKATLPASARQIFADIHRATGQNQGQQQEPRNGQQGGQNQS
jgi:hypothetical protein